MGVSIHLLNKNFIDEKDIAIIIKKVAEKMKLRLIKKNDYYTIVDDNNLNDDGLGNQLDIYPNDYQEYLESIDGLFYPNVPNYGRNIVIGYYTDDKLLVPFLKEFLSDFPEIKVFADDGLPIGVDSRLYSKIDFDSATTTDTFTFLRTPPMENGNTVV